MMASAEAGVGERRVVRRITEGMTQWRSDAVKQ
jgi:hypothetical protein